MLIYNVLFIITDYSIPKISLQSALWLKNRVFFVILMERVPFEVLIFLLILNPFLFYPRYNI